MCRLVCFVSQLLYVRIELVCLLYGLAFFLMYDLCMVCMLCLKFACIGFHSSCVGLSVFYVVVCWMCVDIHALCVLYTFPAL